MRVGRRRPISAALTLALGLGIAIPAAARAQAPPASTPKQATGVPGAKPQGTPSAEPKAAVPSQKASPAAPAAAQAPPTPAAPATPEAKYLAALDEAIAPLHRLKVADSVAAQLKAASKAAQSGDPASASAVKAQLTDAVARKLVDWMILRAGFGEASDFRAFLDANPYWPDRLQLTRRAEEQLFASGGTAERIRAFFGKSEPRSGAGWAALASAHLVLGETAKAKSLAQRVWREMELAQSLEPGFLERFKGLVGEADHLWRFDRLIVDDARWKAEKSERATVARRLLALIPENLRTRAEARLAVFTGAALTPTLQAALELDPDGTTDWGLAYQRVQFLRRSGQNAAANKLLLALPADPALIVSPDDWWTERRNAAYEALKAGDPKLAYALAKETKGLSVNPYKDATFLAGWIALRHLKDAKLARTHFAASLKAADGPLSRARAAYWLARAMTALGETREARSQLEAAALNADTFYGQLARTMLEPKAKFAFRLPARPSEEEIKRFLALDAVQAAVIAHKAGLGQGVVRLFLIQLRFHLKSEGELALLAHLAAALGDTQLSVRLAKAAIAAGLGLHLYGYPVHPLPDFAPLRASPERALLLAIARQESEFNSQTVSGAGARGLLQVMPVTARHVCRDYRLRCEIPRLLTDNAYNARIASAYVADRMGELSGSYVLGIAAYNAGPGRVRQWMREFGDPRDPAVDTIDWIERIPFEETREYVKKVLSNVQVYRSLMGNEMLSLAADLVRGRRRGEP